MKLYEKVITLTKLSAFSILWICYLLHYWVLHAFIYELEYLIFEVMMQIWAAVEDVRLGGMFGRLSSRALLHCSHLMD